jgi:hypothetical protein
MFCRYGSSTKAFRFAKTDDVNALLQTGFLPGADNAARMPESGYNNSRKGPAM